MLRLTPRAYLSLAGRLEDISEDEDDDDDDGSSEDEDADPLARGAPFKCAVCPKARSRV